MLLVLTALLGGLAYATPASAAQSCDGYFDFGTLEFEGGLETTGATIGADALIETNNPIHLCTGSDGSNPDKFVAAFSMVFATSVDTTNCGPYDPVGGYAQAGFMKRNSWSNTYYFGEHWKNACEGTFDRDLGSAIGSNTSYQYTTVYLPPAYCGSYCIAMYVDATLLNYTNYNPVSYWSDVYAEFLGERHDPGDDIVGTASDSTQLTDLQVQDLWSGWDSTNNLDDLVQVHASRSDSNYSDNDTFSIWTDDP